MKCAIILALAAFTSATPLSGWSGTGWYPSRESWGAWGHQTPQKEVAHQVAHQVTQGAVYDQLAHTNEAIRNLQAQLHQYTRSYTGFSSGYPYGSYGGVGIPYHQGISTTGPSGVAHLIASEVVQHTRPSVTADAIGVLQDDMQHQQSQLGGMGPFGHLQGNVIHQLHDTVEAGVEAQSTAGEAHHQQAAFGAYVPTVSGLDAGVFQTRLRKLIDEHNEQEIENQIGHHHHWAQQLHHQQQFVNQEKHQIEAQLAVVQHQGAPETVHQLEQAHHHLQMQEYYLIQGQLAHHLASLQLQEALVHKEQHVLQDTVAEHIQEQAARGTPSVPFSRRF